MIGRPSPSLAPSAARRAVDRALDWLYPRQCLACEEETASIGALCQSCWNETSFIAEPACRRCGAPLAFSAPERASAARPSVGPATPCPACERSPIAWSETRAATVYGGGARRLVLALKHGDRLEAAQPMGRWMARAGAALLAPDDKGLRPWLAPTPLHWRRRLARRGDQAAALAGAVARETGAPLATGALRRVKATPRLEGFSRRARAEALRDVIAPRRGWARRIEGARVVMIDDVLTTGATLNACAAALHAMGARRVDALVFARVVPPEDHDFE